MISGDVLGERARLSPEKVALVEVATGRRFTYAELDGRAKAAARVLTEGLGLGKGDRLALLAGNCVEFLDVFFACGKTGVVLVPLNTRQTAGELEGIVSDAEPKALIYGAGFEETVEDLLGRVGGVTGVPLSSLPEAASAAAAESSSSNSPGPEDLYCLLYTSGTTGKPKGVMVPHRMVAWNAVNTVVSWQLREDDVSPIYTPLYHAGGLGAFLTPIFAVGGTIVLFAGFDPAEILATIGKERCTVVLGVPTIFRMLQEHPAFASADFSSVRYFISGGAPLPMDIIGTWQKRGAAFKQGYGLTEVGVNCFAMSVADSVRKAGSIGRPMMFTEAKLTDEDGREVPVGEVGELLLRGPHVCAGYYRNAEATAAALDDAGWFHTGDLAKKDADGFFTIAGRKKDMLISGGVNVYPAEIEGVLFQHPGVKDVAVVGVPDEKWGEAGVAFVVRREERGEEKISLNGEEGRSAAVAAELAEFVAARLAKYKVPRDFVFVESVPRTPYGKVVKRDLRTSYLSKKSSSSSSSSGVLAHRVDGEGLPLLLLNGGMMSLSAWEPIARRLAERHRVIRCDFRGQLLSPGPPRATMEEHADDVATLLDSLGETRVDVVAASFGAYVALLLAARHPERVASLVAATVTDVADEGLSEPGARLAAAVRAAAQGGDRTAVYDAIVHLAYTPEWQAAHAEEISARRARVGLLPDAWFTGLEGLLGALTRVDLRPVLAKIACPVLVVAAGRDAAMPFERTEAVAAAIPGASLVVVAGSGHALIVEREAEFVLLVERFLGRVGASRDLGDSRA